MVAGTIAGNISAEATTPASNTFAEAMRGVDAPDTIEGISLIGHETVHTTQYDQYGAIGLARRYKAANDANLKAGMTPYNAYRNNPYEVAGWDMGAKILNDLNAKSKGASGGCEL